MDEELKLKTCTVCCAKHEGGGVKCGPCKAAFVPAERANGSSKAGYIVRAYAGTFLVLYKDNSLTALNPTPQEVSRHDREQDAEAEARRLLGINDNDSFTPLRNVRKGGNRGKAASAIGKLLKAPSTRAGEARPRLVGVKP